METALRHIGVIHSCYTEKFGIPRQPGLVAESTAEVEIFSPYNREEAFRELDGFSHIWIVFFMHAIAPDEWKPCVRPPRLGGNQRIGVFASRSGFRPNPIGLSAVKLEQIIRKNNGIKIVVTGGDFLDQTPVLDLKPYLPYADRIPAAVGGFASEAPEAKMDIRFSQQAQAACREKESGGYPGLSRLIVQTLSLDPRPAYYAASPARKRFGMKLYRFDIKWEVRDSHILITAIENG